MKISKEILAISKKFKSLLVIEIKRVIARGLLGLSQHNYITKVLKTFGMEFELRRIFSRPISLCTVSYKIISKILVNRTRPLLSKCISSNHSDNILIINELFANFNKRKGRTGFYDY